MKVSDIFRVNNLSLKPGGSTIKILRKDKKTLEYDKIKNPRAYLSKLNFSNFLEVWVDDVLIFNNN